METGYQLNTNPHLEFYICDTDHSLRINFPGREMEMFEILLHDLGNSEEGSWSSFLSDGRKFAELPVRDWFLVPIGGRHAQYQVAGDRSKD